MGLISINQFFAKHTSLAPSPLTETDQRNIADIERIARSLAEQGGAPAQDWPLFVEPAESLVRLSKKWTEIC